MVTIVIDAAETTTKSTAPAIGDIAGNVQQAPQETHEVSRDIADVEQTATGASARSQFDR